jgi:cytochrome b pre-mRNA-processing protein 3
MASHTPGVAVNKWRFEMGIPGLSAGNAGLDCRVGGLAYIERHENFIAKTGFFAKMPMLARLFAGRRHERQGFALYTRLVTSCRDPKLFAALAIPDTLDGRFDVVALYVALLIHRLRHLPEPGPRLAQAVFDAMFSDMDLTLRELGVGDLSVPRRMKQMWEAFHGRALAYEAALDEADQKPQRLSDALARNVWRGAAPPGSAEGLAQAALAYRDALQAVAAEAFYRMAVDFPVPSRFLPAEGAAA